QDQFLWSSMPTATAIQPISNSSITSQSHGANMRKEMELIVSLSRYDAQEQSLQRARRLLNEDLDWRYVLEAVCYHGVFPAFFHHTKNRFSTLLPRHALKSFDQRNSYINHRRLALVGTFLSVHKQLRNEGVESCTFKGPSLAVTAYGDILKREY